MQLLAGRRRKAFVAVNYSSDVEGREKLG